MRCHVIDFGTLKATQFGEGIEAIDKSNPAKMYDVSHNKFPGSRFQKAGDMTFSESTQNHASLS